jgi:hypothetical protein
VATDRPEVVWVFGPWCRTCVSLVADGVRARGFTGVLAFTAIFGGTEGVVDFVVDDVGFRTFVIGFWPGVIGFFAGVVVVVGFLTAVEEIGAGFLVPIGVLAGFVPVVVADVDADGLVLAADWSGFWMGVEVAAVGVFFIGVDAVTGFFTGVVVLLTADGVPSFFGVVDEVVGFFSPWATLLTPAITFQPTWNEAQRFSRKRHTLQG